MNNFGFQKFADNNEIKADALRLANLLRGCLHFSAFWILLLFYSIWYVLVRITYWVLLGMAFAYNLCS